MILKAPHQRAQVSAVCPHSYCRARVVVCESKHHINSFVHRFDAFLEVILFIEEGILMGLHSKHQTM